MTTVLPISQPSAPPSGRRVLARGAALALLWFGLNGTDWNSWVVGGPAVVAATWVSVRLLPTTPWRWSVGGAIRFAAFFLRESWRGGWLVARHAIATPLKISPGFVRHEFRLGPGPARWFFCNTISLLPGTAVVAIESDALVAHVLDVSPQSAHELRELERRIAALFGFAPVEPGEGTP
jgi:multicomponent Na+:H+ antiporter subunit E